MPFHSFNKYEMELEREFDNVVEPGGGGGGGGAGSGGGGAGGGGKKGAGRVRGNGSTLWHVSHWKCT